MTVAIGVLTLLAAIPSVGFVGLYSRMPWYKSQVGRGVMILSTAVLLLVGMGVLRTFFGTDYTWKQPLLLSVYIALVAGQWSMFVALLVVRRVHPERLTPKP